MSTNYFKQPRQYNKNTNTNTNEPRSFNNFKSFSTNSAEVVPVYIPKESDFPELISTKKSPSVNVVADCKYSNIAASNMDTKIVEKNIIPDGCCQIIINKKSKQMELKVGKEKQTNIKPLRIQEGLDIDTIICELENNWNKYQAEYDSIHGEGSYIEAHYMEPVYPFLDEEYETESEYSDYSAETDMDNNI